MRKRWIVPALLLVLLLTGCGEGKDSSVLVIDRHETVTSYIVEDFSASYLNAEELKTNVTEEINKANEGQENPVVELTKLEVEEGILRSTMEYQNTKAYEEFNEETLFVGTIDEAKEKGYSLDIDLYGVKDLNTKVKLSTVQTEDMKVLIFSEPVSVKAPKKILYISDGLVPGKSSKKADVTDNTKEIYYIFYE